MVKRGYFVDNRYTSFSAIMDYMVHLLGLLGYRGGDPSFGSFNLLTSIATTSPQKLLPVYFLPYLAVCLQVELSKYCKSGFSES